MTLLCGAIGIFVTVASVLTHIIGAARASRKSVGWLVLIAMMLYMLSARLLIGAIILTL